MKVDDKEIKRMVLEDQILDYQVASLRVFKGHWISQYYQHRMNERIKEWEQLTGRRYEDNRKV